MSNAPRLPDDDHAERGFTPVLRGVDDDRLNEIAIRLYRPWYDNAGPSYTTIAEILPYSSTWVGNCVRAWNDGDYRELVPDPTAEHTPSVDDDSATAVATDGGRRPRRWAAYGSD